MLYFSFSFLLSTCQITFLHTHTHTLQSLQMTLLVMECACFEGCLGFLGCVVQQVQAVLLLLGGRDVPTGVPTIEVPFNQNNRVPQNLKLLKARSCIFCAYSHGLSGHYV